MTKQTCGFIGLGAMGYSMATNLFKQERLSAVYNRDTKKSEAFQHQTKVPFYTKLEDIAKSCNVIICCVSDDEALMQVIKELLPSLQAGSIIIDTSTVSRQCITTVSDLLNTVNVDFLDAPMSGGIEGAQNAALVFMVGGDPEVFERAKPLLHCMANTVTLMGGSGMGQATKAVNQIMAAGINQAVCEALAFSQASGLDSNKVIDVISNGAAANWLLEHRGKNMLKGNFDSGFKVSLHYKDLLLCRGMMEKFSDEERLPIVEMTILHYIRLMSHGHGDEDISTLIRLKHKLFKSNMLNN